MTRRVRRPAYWSLAHRQLVILASSLTLVAVLLGVGGGWYIDRFAERTSDRVLRAAVNAIAETIALERGTITLEVPPSAFGMLEDSARDNVYYAVRSGSRVLTGYADLPRVADAELAGDETHFRYASYLGQRVRIAARARRLPRMTQPVVVEVAETLAERRALALRMLIGLLALEAVLVFVAVLLIRPAVRWGLAPLARLQTEIAARKPGQRGHQPIDTAGIPSELGGVVDAFNALLGRLDAASDRIRRFTADASHQMRTPLAALKAHLAIARQQGSSPQRIDTALDEIDAAADRLNRLLSQLLGLARADNDAGSTTTGSQAVDLQALAAEVTRELAPTAIAAGIDIHFEPGDTAIVRTQPLMVSEIVSNLIDNAIRYNRRGGSVVVRIAAGGRAIEVEDDGPGIPADQRAAVFQRFFRLDRDSGVAGSGLGLPIVRALADAIGAHVSLSDARGGQGLLTTLSFDERLTKAGQGYDDATTR